MANGGLGGSQGFVGLRLLRSTGDHRPGGGTGTPKNPDNIEGPVITYLFSSSSLSVIKPQINESGNYYAKNITSNFNI